MSFSSPPHGGFCISRRGVCRRAQHSSVIVYGTSSSPFWMSRCAGLTCTVMLVQWRVNQGRDCARHEDLIAGKERCLDGRNNAANHVSERQSCNGRLESMNCLLYTSDAADDLLC